MNTMDAINTGVLDSMLTSLCNDITHKIDQMLVNLQIAQHPELSWRNMHLRSAYNLEVDNSWVETCYSIISDEILMEIRNDILTRFKLGVDREHRVLYQVNTREEFNDLFYSEDSFTFLNSFFARIFAKINPGVTIHSSFAEGEVFLHPCAGWFYQEALIIPIRHGAIYARNQGVTYNKAIDPNTFAPQVKFQHDYTISVPRTLKVITVGQDTEVPF